MLRLCPSLNPHRLRLTLSDEDNRAFLLVVLLTHFLLMGAESANRSIIGLKFISQFTKFRDAIIHFFFASCDDLCCFNPEFTNLSYPVA